MYDNYRNPHPPGMQMPPPNPQPGPYDNPLYGASSGLIKTGLGVYGEKFLGSSSEFMQSNVRSVQRTLIPRVFQIAHIFSLNYYWLYSCRSVDTSPTHSTTSMWMISMSGTSWKSYCSRSFIGYVSLSLPSTLDIVLVLLSIWCTEVKVFALPSQGHWTRISEPVGGRLSYKPPMYDINAPDLYIPFMAFGSFIILAGFTLGFMGKWVFPSSFLTFIRKTVRHQTQRS